MSCQPPHNVSGLSKGKQQVKIKLHALMYCYPSSADVCLGSSSLDHAAGYEGRKGEKTTDRREMGKEGLGRVTDGTLFGTDRRQCKIWSVGYNYVVTDSQ